LSFLFQSCVGSIFLSPEIYLSWQLFIEAPNAPFLLKSLFPQVPSFSPPSFPFNGVGLVAVPCVETLASFFMSQLHSWFFMTITDLLLCNLPASLYSARRSALRFFTSCGSDTRYLVFPFESFSPLSISPFLPRTPPPAPLGVQHPLRFSQGPLLSTIRDIFLIFPFSFLQFLYVSFSPLFFSVVFFSTLFPAGLCFPRRHDFNCLSGLFSLAPSFLSDHTPFFVFAFSLDSAFLAERFFPPPL